MYVIRPKMILQAKVKQLAQIIMVPTLATLPFLSHPSSMGNSLWLVDKRKEGQSDIVQMVFHNV